MLNRFLNHHLIYLASLLIICTFKKFQIPLLISNDFKMNFQLICFIMQLLLTKLNNHVIITLKQ